MEASWRIVLLWLALNFYKLIRFIVHYVNKLFNSFPKSSSNQSFSQKCPIHTSVFITSPVNAQVIIEISRNIHNIQQKNNSLSTFSLIASDFTGGDDLASTEEYLKFTPIPMALEKNSKTFKIFILEASKPFEANNILEVTNSFKTYDILDIVPTPQLLIVLDPCVDLCLRGYPYYFWLKDAEIFHSRRNLSHISASIHEAFAFYSKTIQRFGK